MQKASAQRYAVNFCTSRNNFTSKQNLRLTLHLRRKNLFASTRHSTYQLVSHKDVSISDWWQNKEIVCKEHLDLSISINHSGWEWEPHPRKTTKDPHKQEKAERSLNTGLCAHLGVLLAQMPLSLFLVFRVITAVEGLFLKRAH